jgi:hypothetical protein
MNYAAENRLFKKWAGRCGGGEAKQGTVRIAGRGEKQGMVGQQRGWPKEHAGATGEAAARQQTKTWMAAFHCRT